MSKDKGGRHNILFKLLWFVHSRVFFFDRFSFDWLVQSINHSVRRSVSQTQSRSVSQTQSQSVNRSVSQSINQSHSQSVSRSVGQAVCQTDRQTDRQSVSQSVTRSVSQSIVHTFIAVDKMALRLKEPTKQFTPNKYPETEMYKVG